MSNLAYTSQTIGEETLKTSHSLWIIQMMIELDNSKHNLSEGFFQPYYISQHANVQRTCTADKLPERTVFLLLCLLCHSKKNNNLLLIATRQVNELLDKNNMKEPMANVEL